MAGIRLLPASIAAALSVMCSVIRLVSACRAAPLRSAMSATRSARTICAPATWSFSTRCIADIHMSASIWVTTASSMHPAMEGAWAWRTFWTIIGGTTTTARGGSLPQTETNPSRPPLVRGGAKAVKHLPILHLPWFPPRPGRRGAGGCDLSDPDSFDDLRTHRDRGAVGPAITLQVIGDAAYRILGFAQQIDFMIAVEIHRIVAIAARHG